jgi:hypothetical protein
MIKADLTRETQVRYLATGTGFLGSSYDYLQGVVDHLHEMDIPDPDLDALLAATEAEMARRSERLTGAFMETLAQDLRTMVRTPLTEAHVAAMRRVGREETLAADEMLYRTGDVQDRFIYLLEGEVAALDPITGDTYGDATLGPGQFFGEISFLWGGAMMMGARTLQDTRS